MTKPPPRNIVDPRPNPDTPRDPLMDLPWPDIFTALPHMPERVYVVGSGPQGLEPSRSIPENAYCLALNSAICLWRKWEWWVCGDHRVMDTDWWCDFTVHFPTRTLYSARLANRMHTDHTIYPWRRPDYYYRYHPGLTGASFKPGQPCLIPGMLRSLTVAGSALQFAYYSGAREIVLCGIDMYGKKHFDGHENPDDCYKAKWPWADNLSKLCRVLEGEGLKITSISKTALEVPVVAP
ncbi:MAG: hypothetical protein WC381_11435 [Kiritimatiellia bacterium]|jgi:hypothetical protein